MTAIQDEEGGPVVRFAEPSRGPTSAHQAAVLIPKALAEYGEKIAELLALDEKLVRHFEALKRLEAQLREHGVTPPRPDLSPRLKAAWRTHKGELP